MDREADWTRTDLFNGKGRVSIWGLMDGAPAPPFSAALWCSLAPKGSVGNHRQQEDPELILAVEGQGQIRINGVISPFTKGRLYYLKLGATLAIRNTSSTEELVYVIIKARTG